MKYKYHLNRYNIPELNSKDSHYTTASSKDNAIYNFAVNIVKKRFDKNMWKAKLKDIKKEIFPYIEIIKENKMKKLELQKIIKEEVKNILLKEEDDKWKVSFHNEVSGYLRNSIKKYKGKYPRKINDSTLNDVIEFSIANILDYLNNKNYMI